MGGLTGRGCAALGGMVLLGAGLFAAALGVGVGAGVMRDDPRGLTLIGAAVALIGLALCAVAARRK